MHFDQPRHAGINSIFSYAVWACCVVLFLLSGQISAAPIVLTEGTLIGVDAGFNRIVQKTTDGTTFNTQTFQNIGNEFGLEVVNESLYVMDLNERVFEVDTRTGAATHRFTATGFNSEAIGSNGTNLLLAGFTVGEVREYAVDGTFLGRTVLTGAASTGWTGVDSDGSNFYLSRWWDGRVYKFDATGAFVSSFVAAPPNNLSGLAYDATTDTVWVTTGQGDDMLRQFDQRGNQLTAFPSSTPSMFGLDFINPQNLTAVPEPASVSLLALGSIGLLATRRRRRKGERAA